LNLLDFFYCVGYTSRVHEIRFCIQIFFEGLLIMKLAVRAFAVLVVVAGFAAASMSSASAKNVVSQQSATAHMPVPVCAPGLPTCGNIPSSPTAVGIR
jgi:hypothetical protein